jgi:hypothetical protein
MCKDRRKHILNGLREIAEEPLVANSERSGTPILAICAAIALGEQHVISRNSDDPTP